LAASVPATVAPAAGARRGVELAAGVPTLEVADDVTLVEVVVAGAAGEMPPPVRSPGPAPEGSVDVGVTAELVAGGGGVELVCARTGADAPNNVNKSAAPTIAIARMAIAT
jgi:hypothetical protein